jgi:hypothetical protein
MNTNDKQHYVQKIQQFPKFSYFKTDSSEKDGKLYLNNRESDWKHSLYFTVHNLRFFVNKEFFAYFADRYKYELLNTDTDKIPRPVLDDHEGPQFLRMLITKKMTIRGMKLTQYDRDKTPLCIIVIRSTANEFIKTQNVSSYYDEYWYHLHVHYDGKGEYPGNITNIKLVYALQDELRYFEKGIYVDASEDDKRDYNNIGRQKLNEPVGNWGQDRQNLEECLNNWVKSQKNGLKIWENKANWNRIAPARLGNVAVRDRSRYLITKDIDVTKLKNTIDEQNSVLRSKESEELSSDESTESTSNEVGELTSDKGRSEDNYEKERCG